MDFFYINIFLSIYEYIYDYIHENIGTIIYKYKGSYTVLCTDGSDNPKRTVEEWAEERNKKKDIVIMDENKTWETHLETLHPIGIKKTDGKFVIEHIFSKIVTLDYLFDKKIFTKNDDIPYWVKNTFTKTKGIFDKDTLEGMTSLTLRMDFEKKDNLFAMIRFEWLDSSIYMIPLHQMPACVCSNSLANKPLEEAHQWVTVFEGISSKLRAPEVKNKDILDVFTKVGEIAMPNYKPTLKIYIKSFYNLEISDMEQSNTPIPFDPANCTHWGQPIYVRDVYNIQTDFSIYKPLFVSGTSPGHYKVKVNSTKGIEGTSIEKELLKLQSIKNEILMGKKEGYRS